MAKRLFDSDIVNYADVENLSLDTNEIKQDNFLLNFIDDFCLLPLAKHDIKCNE